MWGRQGKPAGLSPCPGLIHPQHPHQHHTNANEKPSVIQTRRQELTTKPGVGVVRVWGLVWGIGPPSSSHSIHQSPSPHNLPAIHTTLAWGGNRGWRVDVACWWGVGGPSNPTVSPHTPHPNTTPTSTSQHACSSMGSCVGLMLVLWVSCEVGNVSLCGVCVLLPGAHV